MTNEQAIEDLKALKQYFIDTMRAAPTCLDFAIETIMFINEKTKAADDVIKEFKRPQGEWLLDETEQFCYCSICEDTYYQRPLDPSWHYCPHCGANMEGGK